MEYAGRATSIKFEKKLNGTHTLTFSMPDKWYDSKLGDYVYNEFIDQMYNERKVKFFYKNKWYEFYIKSISEAKNFKSYMKTYTCNDAFIDELSRNGYGLTFDEELYNNVEEIGTFTEEILEDSIWYYAPQNNWGDFTEFLEEKLFKIPVSQFESLWGYKLNYNVENSDSKIINAYTNEKRDIEMGDDLARQEGLFWDQRGENGQILNPLISIAPTLIENDGYIYVPYSQLNFCYKTTIDGNSSIVTATEEPCFYWLNGEQKSYAITPATIDPSALIQFIAIPKDAVVEIDEAGTIVNKNYTYVMTVEQWNNALRQNGNFYSFEPFEQMREQNGVLVRRKIKDYVFGEQDANTELTGNYTAYYEGYLDSIGNIEVLKGKKISISDRTEVNITNEIDQYVKVYNNLPQDIITNDFTYTRMLDENKDWKNGYDNYKICSKSATRQVIPQLARNLTQNGVNIRSADGWEVVKLSDDKNVPSSTIKFIKKGNGGAIQLTKSGANDGEGIGVDVASGEGDTDAVNDNNYERYGRHDLNTVINFGIVGQNITLSKEKIYVLGFKGNLSPNDAIIIGEGSVISSGDYKVYWEHASLRYTGNFYSISSFMIDGALNVNNEATFIFIKPLRDFINPYIGIWMRDNDKDLIREVEELWFFEAYTKGRDQFVKYDAHFRYSGRTISDGSDGVVVTEQNYTNKNGETYYNYIKEGTDFIIRPYTRSEIKKYVIFEDDVMPGDTYEYQQYFIQQISAGDQVADTFAQKKFLSEDGPKSNNILPFNSSEYTEDDLNFNTAYFNLNKCPYYNENGNADQPDCSYCNGTCLYQKDGYCPYLFQTEKHCRKIRTLKKDKSNRFNLTQELSKVFEIYPIYFTNNDSQGRIVKKVETIDNKPVQIMDKRIFYITEKGKENKLGFRYEKNLSNISRTLKSDQIVTKLYVQDVDSDISNTGLCSIKTAEDNPSKDSFIIDFSYYVSKGLISADQAERDLYGIESGDMAYLKQLGYYNTQYDKLSNLIINLQSESYTELEANVDVNFEGIIAAKQQLHKLKKQLSKYGETVNSTSEKSTVQNTIIKFNEQLAILNSLYEETFGLNNDILVMNEDGAYEFRDDIKDVLYLIVDKTSDSNIYTPVTMENFKETDYYKNHLHEWGMLGQFNREYRQIQEWKKLQATYLRKINELSLNFFKKYEPYIKEGTWTDSNYLTDNAYYFGALEVAAEGAIPKVSYTITIVDLSTKPEYEDDYEFDIADTTYVEDIGMFGVNQKTGLPNRLKVLISSITEDPDVPTSNSINVQNFTTQFEDLFQQVSATVQSLTYNENIYKRSSNFTSNQNVKEDSLQGTLDSNNLTLINTKENNIELDSQGQAGSDINNHSNKYKLNGQGLFFSNNGGQTWNVGVGPSGINADYIKVGSLDAGKIKIVDNDFLYFYWDKDGIIALKEPSEDAQSSIFNSYAMFNRYGLSLVENGKIKLRAGYEFNSASNGEIKTESSQSNRLGFYLYDNSGYPIFRTEAASDITSEARDKKTARLSLRGEMFVTDGFLSDSLQADFYVFSVSCYSQNIYLGHSCQKPNNFENEYVEFSPELKCYFYTSDGYKYHVSRGDSERFQSTVDNNLYLIHYKGKNNDKDEWFSINTTEQTEQVYIIGDYGASVVTNISSEEKLESVTKNNSLVFDGVEGNLYGEKVYTYGQLYANVKTVKNTENPNTIGLYLNNKMENGSASEQNGYIKRILSCVKEENGNLNNILSILQNGSLYIGGVVDPQYSNERTISELSDLIKIDNAGIELIKENGQYQIRMDFANFKDTNGNNLASSITGTQEDVGNIKNKLNEVIERIDKWNDDWFYNRPTTVWNTDIGQI